MEFDWKTRVRQLLYAPAKISDNAKAIGLMLDHWPEPTQEACQQHCKADLLKRQSQSLKDRNRNLEEQVSTLQGQLKWRKNILRKAIDSSGCPPERDLEDHFGRLVTERDEFRRLHEEEQETIKECADLRRNLHAVINEAKEALGVPDDGSLVEACAAVAKERDRLLAEVDRWKIASGLERVRDPDGVRPEKAKEYWQGIKDRLIIVEDERGDLEEEVEDLYENREALRKERDALQTALAEQMAENGRMAARVKFFEEEKEERRKHDMMCHLSPGG